MVFDRTWLEVIADVELEEDISALAHDPLDFVELLLVKLDVRNGRESLDSDFRIINYMNFNSSLFFIRIFIAIFLNAPNS